MLNNKKITLGITGGIAAYKAADIANILTKERADVKVIMTKHATEFITPLTLQLLSKNKVITDMFEEDNSKIVNHIYFAQEADILVIAPATANILGKVANGIADDILSSTIIASTKPVLFAPAMNEHMYLNPIVQNNIKKLKEYGYYFIEPQTGHLACGTKGVGKLAKTKDIVDKIKEILKED